MVEGGREDHLPILREDSMAADWLRQYSSSSSDIARSASFKGDIYTPSRRLSYRRRESSNNSIYNGSYRTTNNHGSYNPSERLYTNESTTAHANEGLNFDGLVIGERRSVKAVDIPSNHGTRSSCAASSGGGSSYAEGSLGIFLKRRRSSVVFDPKVRLDNGAEAELRPPVPKLSIKTRPRGKSLLEEMDRFQNKGRAASENDRQEYDPVSGERLDEKEEREAQQRRSARYKTNESRWPLLQSTVDQLASEIQQQQPPPIIPKESQSLPLAVEETRGVTNIDAVLSPMNIPSAEAQWSTVAARDIPLPFSSRSKSYAIERYNSFGSKLPRSYRRPPTAHSNSASPASLFLSRYSPSSPVSQPDDEGQEVGDYVLGREIGFGGFSIIREAVTMSGDEKIVRAVKIVRKNVSGRDEHENDTLESEFEHEVEIWRSLSHPYILPLFAVYSTDFATFAITHLNTGGTLFDVVRSNRDGLDTRLTKRYALQLAAAIRYLHEDMHIVHRDIKLENCLIDRSAENAHETGGKLLLCDFGLADHINADITSYTRQAYQGRYSSGTTGSGSQASTTITHPIGPADTSTNFAGSLPYAAPELLQSDPGILTPSVDMWAYGVVLFALAMGHLPFTHSFAPRLRLMILGEEWDKTGLRLKEEQAMSSDISGQSPAYEVDGNSYHPNPHAGLSELIERCMELDPFTRWEIQDVLCSQWLQDEIDLADIEE